MSKLDNSCAARCQQKGMLYALRPRSANDHADARSPLAFSLGKRLEDRFANANDHALRLRKATIAFLQALIVLVTTKISY